MKRRGVANHFLKRFNKRFSDSSQPKRAVSRPSSLAISPIVPIVTLFQERRPRKGPEKPLVKKRSKRSLTKNRRSKKAEKSIFAFSFNPLETQTPPQPFVASIAPEAIEKAHPQDTSASIQAAKAAQIEAQAGAEQKVEAASPADTQVLPPELPTQPEAAVPAPVTPADPQMHFPGFAPLALSIQEILKPNDSLRNSIEAFLLDQRSPHTRRAYGKDLKRFVKFLLERKQNQGVESLNRMILIGYKESLLAEKLEHTTVDRHIATLKSFFKWLVEDGLILRSPADGVRFLNPKRLSTTQGFSDEEVKKVLATPDLHTRTGALHYAILMVLFYCGLRRSELCALRTKNIGTERNQVVLRLRGKGNAERLIVVINPVWNAIRYYLYITHRSLEKDESLFVPLRNNRTGVVKKPLDPSTIFYIVRKYAKQAGIANRVSPHSCRATAISNARDHHVPDRAIQEFAGWASPDMITRYDKRRTSVEESAAHAISYGAEDRSVPVGEPGQSVLFDPGQPVPPSEASSSSSEQFTPAGRFLPAEEEGEPSDQLPTSE